VGREAWKTKQVSSTSLEKCSRRSGRDAARRGRTKGDGRVERPQQEGRKLRLRTSVRSATGLERERERERESGRKMPEGELSLPPSPLQRNERTGKERAEADAPLNEKPTRLLYPNRGRAWKRALSIPARRCASPRSADPVPTPSVLHYAPRYSCSSRADRPVSSASRGAKRAIARLETHASTSALISSVIAPPRTRPRSPLAPRSVYIMTGKVNLIGSEYSLHSTANYPAPD